MNSKHFLPNTQNSLKATTLLERFPDILKETMATANKVSVNQQADMDVLIGALGEISADEDEQILSNCLTLITLAVNLSFEVGQENHKKLPALHRAKFLSRHITNMVRDLTQVTLCRAAIKSIKENK